MEFKTGSLINFRNRNWVLLPEQDDRILKIKPLGGHEIETLRILKELHIDQIKPSTLPFPTEDDLGNIQSGKLLYHAARLSLRTGAGPFRSFGKLSVRPRPYQVVPLVMALRQEKIRLLIADDVGIGKTVEALLILKEMLERGKIQRFAVLCPPHLCDQWQNELSEKFGIESEIVSSATAGKLDRKYHSDDHLFKKLNAMVISIDYLKSEKFRSIFVDNCPEMVIVDEAHNAAASDSRNSSQQMRHALIKRISENEEQHLILLTATPHSGKEDVFQSLLGLLKPEFSSYYLSQLDGRSSEIRQVAKHFVQRRRQDILDWLDTNDFPERISEEISYSLHDDYLEIMQKTRALSKTYISSKEGRKERILMKQWAMLSLLRGIASSPAAGSLMLRKKMAQQELQDEEVDAIKNQLQLDVTDDGLGTLDHESIETPEITSYLSQEFRTLADKLETLGSLEFDYKAKRLLDHLLKLIKDGYRPIVFSRFIRTAEYLQELLSPKLQKEFGKSFNSVAITSTLNDEQRRERIQELCTSTTQRVLFATDCLSEGINLQEHFNAVIHYDLPWNPNRLEQREGRVDRFGQNSPTVQAITLSGEHTMDRAILKVLIRKIREIRNAIGVTIQVPNSKSLIESMSDEVFRDEEIQLDLALDLEKTSNARQELDSELERTKNREVQTRDIFKQLNINPQEISPDLVDSDQLLGDPTAVKSFLLEALGYAQARIVKDSPLVVERSNMSLQLWQALSTGDEKVTLALEAPYPEGYRYVGRTHPFVERLSSHLLKAAFDRSEEFTIRRASVISQAGIDQRHVIVLFRIRNVIRSTDRGHELVAEELHLWGYKGLLKDGNILSEQDSFNLLQVAQPTSERPFEIRSRDLHTAVQELKMNPSFLDQITRDRTKKLIESHSKYNDQVKSEKFIGVEPVLPPDPIAIYIIQPDLTGGLS